MPGIVASAGSPQETCLSVWAFHASMSMAHAQSLRAGVSAGWAAREISYTLGMERRWLGAQSGGSPGLFRDDLESTGLCIDLLCASHALVVVEVGVCGCLVASQVGTCARCLPLARRVPTYRRADGRHCRDTHIHQRVVWPEVAADEGGRRSGSSPPLLPKS